ncbi:RNA recognition motif. (a.k.a. RRM, RBD, or RNP domain) [Verrucomicrobium sp. GAS474]|uniref:hypothetical protein n=1 Tax=Verrucomicrobium sp. GAS474 TaxID=1882831 RepID=UPI00087A485C|nr:hypothetical protein [Verrucomicrobium sp. GAS474]SDT86534.1 RNA recognition motif. (a.k.a. RRM, RBD, or RNP domain) [Verrucomicrobium sp. GAS474]
MSSDYSPRSGGRRRRRGGRGNQAGQGAQGGGRSHSFNKDSAPREGGKRDGAKTGGGLWCKIKSLFGLGKKKDARSSEPRAPRSEHPTLRRAEEQKQREPRGERGERSERGPRQPREERAPRQPREEREPREPRAPRNAEPQKTELEEANPDAVTIPRLYIGNLAYETAESDIFDLFSKVGSVRNVELVMDRRSNRSKGFGFVEMADLEVAKKAVVTLHRSDFMGRQLIVSGAKSERRIEAAPVTQELPPIE